MHKHTNFIQLTLKSHKEKHFVFSFYYRKCHISEGKATTKSSWQTFLSLFPNFMITFKWCDTVTVIIRSHSNFQGTCTQYTTVPKRKWVHARMKELWGKTKFSFSAIVSKQHLTLHHNIAWVTLQFQLFLFRAWILLFVS